MITPSQTSWPAPRSEHSTEALTKGHRAASSAHPIAVRKHQAFELVAVGVQHPLAVLAIGGDVASAEREGDR